MALLYEKLSPELEERIRQDRAARPSLVKACPDEAALRRDMDRDRAKLWRPAFGRDVDKILHSAYYSRYADKTQVFSFYKNDDVTRRALHVQLVSRIARNIGGVLGLNLDLLEAIALGHDIGHTPFGHAGEKILSDLYQGHTGRVFVHNVHSVRVLDRLFPYNITLQTLNGILAHNGEIELAEYRPSPMTDFAAFDAAVDACYSDIGASAQLAPSTLEGCVVRICDIIAYLGKDRQDAVRAGLIDADGHFGDGSIGKRNAEIINNLTVNIIENSYGKDAICMDEAHFQALADAKRENYRLIYKTAPVADKLSGYVKPMMEKLYEKLLQDARAHDEDSFLFRHHVSFVNANRRYYGGAPYEEMATENDMVMDYIASMTDDYFIDLFHHLFPESRLDVPYIGYFS